MLLAVSAYPTVDRFGCKPLFITSSLGMGLSMAGLTGAVYAIEQIYIRRIRSSDALPLPIHRFLPAGVSRRELTYSAEIVPQDLRIHLASIGTDALAVSLCYYYCGDHAGCLCYDWVEYHVVYAVIGVFVAGMVVLFFPETKERGLEEMDRLLGESGNWCEIIVYARTMGRREVGVEKEKGDVEMYE